jgi:hypothetical protein
MSQGVSTNPPLLSYAPRSRVMRTWVKQSAIIIALIALAASAWHFGPRAWRFSQI